MQPFFTIERFNKLPDKDKWIVIQDHSLYLTSRIDGPFQVALFHLEHFYVEVYLNQVSDRFIKAEAFDDYDMLDLFLQDIDISKIYSVL